MVFVLDNYDSFTYNLVQYLGELGARIEVRRNDQVSVAEVEALRPDRIVVSPGPCTPQEAGISIELIRHFAGKLEKTKRFQLGELLEHLSQSFWRDADAGVGDAELHLASARKLGADRDPSAGGELDRVGNQVGQHLLQP